MAIEIIPKKIEKRLPIENIAFYISVAVLLLVVLSYGLLFYFEARSTVALKSLEEKIAVVGTAEDKLIELEVFQQEKRIKDFSSLVSGRSLSSNFFQNFEKLVHPKIWFSKFNLNVPQLQANLSGYALNFETLDQQMSIFRSQKEIQEVKLSELGLGKKGDATFSLALSLSPDFFATSTVTK